MLENNWHKKEEPFLSMTGLGGAPFQQVLAASTSKIYVDDVFSTDLWTGNSTTQTITNDIDLSGEGGLVWIKGRNDTWTHALFDTERGPGFELDSTQDYGHDSDTQVSSQKDLYQFNSNGYSIGQNYNSYINRNGDTFVGWTFRECPGFFDIVTYTGNGTSGRTIAHNLGSVPGCIMVKRTSDTADWAVYHRANKGFFATDPISNLHLHLNQNHTAQGSSAYWNDTDPTSDVFTVGNSNDVNQNGQTYVAYLFAHDDQSFGTDEDEAIIKCGSYTGTGSLLSVDLGFEPQWLLIKKTQTATATWVMWDTMRGFTISGVDDKFLKANESSAEGTYSSVGITPTGFQVESGDSNTNNSGDNVIYIAIRRPHKPPTAGTDVFAIDTRGSTGDGKAPTYRSGFPVDMQFNRNVTYAGGDMQISARLTQGKQMHTNLTGAESTNSGMMFDYMNGVQTDTGTGSSQYAWMFKRAPGFFDVVTYTGNGVQGRNISHNLEVAPELMIVKNRDTSNDDWMVYVSGITYQSVHGNDPDNYGNNPPTLKLQDSNFVPNFSMSGTWDHTHPTATVFRVGDTGSTNGNGEDLIAYLFASLDGISKVGSYSGSSSSVDVDCGFTNGARFVLIKRIDSTANWTLFDTERGINSGNDPYLRLNSTDAQDSSYDAIDTLASGFTVNSGNGNYNTNGGTYIFLAIA
jgi:hypothetical protein